MGVSIEFKERLDIIEEVVTKSIINLCKNGATIICVGSNIIQYFSTRIKKICSLFNAEFVEIADVLKNSFVTKEINKFDFIGISHAADLNEYNSFSFLEKDFDVAFPDVQTLKIIREISINAKKNTESNKVAQPLGNILKQKTKNETIVVALTEISTVLDHHKKLVKSKTVIDTLQLMADYVAKKYVDGIYTTLFVDEYKDYISYQKLHKPIPESIKKQLWKILLEIDYEFVPPLSFRDSTTFSFDSDLKNTKVPEVYYQNLLKQELMVSMRKNTDEVVGFVSYIPNYTITHDNHSFKCFYITTIGVTKGARGNGIAKQFYKKIEEEAKKKATCTKVATRTWSMDKTHIRILESMGYKKVIEIENDRGLGIHTVYYAKDLNNIH
jgi:ribosomal protein S18 acetylase RimI-like enzyme/aspartate/glutamate racemase